MPRVRRMSSRSVAQNEPLPGLSMIGSPGAGFRSSMISQPGSPRTRILPQGPASPMPAPMRCERQRLFGGRSARSGRWPSRVWMTVVAFGARGGEERLDRLDRRAGQREVVAHLVDIAAFAAEVGLHVDDDDGGVARPPVAVPRPRIRVGWESRHDLFRCLREFLAIVSRRPGKTVADAVGVDDLVLPGQPVAPRHEVLHVGIGTIACAAGHRDHAAVAELIDVVLDRPVLSGLADRGPAGPPR